jgi:hypothetical protein
MKLDEIKGKVQNALNKFYKNDSFLVEKKLCERCLVHRVAVYLENEKFPDYFIDCEYNKSHLNKSSKPKRVSNLNGNFIDIIITKRDDNHQNNLVCFEIKRWINYHKRDKDIENLEILTRGNRFGYSFGFYIIFGKNKEKTKIETYIKGNKKEEFKLVDENEA